MKKNITNEDLKNVFEKAGKDYECILNMLSDLNLSAYKKELLKRKFGLLSLQYNNFILEMQEYLDRKKIINSRVLKLACLMLALSLIGCMFTGNVFVILLLCAGMGIGSVSKLNLEEIKELQSQVNVGQEELNVLIDSCENFYEVKKSDYSFVKDMDKKQDIDIQRANHAIQLYLETGILIDVDSEILNEIVKILQDDLNCEENNVGKLLDMAKEKINNENLQSDLQLCRVLNDRN